MPKTEEWLDCGPEFPGHQASSLGRIKNPKGKILTPRPHNGALRVDIGKRAVMVHDVILKTFSGNPPNLNYRVKHLNEDRTDNREENLMWAQRKAS
ncbi:HNH endonuclease [Mycobacterium phage SirDuracell]|nr:HNH endonuclease [Mycobacterium phage Bask21]YP_009608036.1 HNH endonuclease [Mycobacterium phage SirDuracell]AEJ92624.1 hypothetical protein SEA_RAKIM_107 [Mycobacterium phage Rakim]AXC37486.1 HNH endonuclease [Mycobacterium phage DoctorDiddles]AYR00218.1 HNH endonuclease [Mycobacterium phage Pat3]QAY06633.1 hypothetical protein SEA_COOKIES_103 [Mycobacterium phage Cookies]QDF17721.1 HNH endonuclease [Mycobacterium phage ChotaBhai]QDK01832.1 HNH endonuclease [Mycobacterium phage Gator]